MLAAFGIALALMGEAYTAEAVERMSQKICAPLFLTPEHESCLKEHRQAYSDPDIVKHSFTPAITRLLVWLANLNIEANGWDLLTGGDDSALFVKEAAKTQDGNPSLWTRHEFRTSQAASGMTYRSWAVLEEVDCRQRRSRNLNITAYSDNGLRGQASSVSTSAEWEYSVPGSMGASIVERACTGPSGH